MRYTFPPSTQPNPSPRTYYVYYMHPTSTHPHWRYDCYDTTLSTKDLPATTHYTPQWIYSERTGLFVAVDPVGVWERHAKARRITARVAVRVKSSLEGGRAKARALAGRLRGAVGDAV